MYRRNLQYQYQHRAACTYCVKHRLSRAPSTFKPGPEARTRGVPLQRSTYSAWHSTAKSGTECCGPCSAASQLTRTPSSPARLVRRSAARGSKLLATCIHSTALHCTALYCMYRTVHTIHQCIRHYMHTHYNSYRQHAADHSTIQTTCTTVYTAEEAENLPARCPAYTHTHCTDQHQQY